LTPLPEVAAAHCSSELFLKIAETRFPEDSQSGLKACHLQLPQRIFFTGIKELL
jgi:hypothetical protein